MLEEISPFGDRFIAPGETVVGNRERRLQEAQEYLDRQDQGGALRSLSSMYTEELRRQAQRVVEDPEEEFRTLLLNQLQRAIPQDGVVDPDINDLAFQNEARINEGFSPKALAVLKAEKAQAVAQAFEGLSEIAGGKTSLDYLKELGKGALGISPILQGAALGGAFGDPRDLRADPSMAASALQQVGVGQFTYLRLADGLREVFPQAGITDDDVLDFRKVVDKWQFLILNASDTERKEYIDQLGGWIKEHADIGDLGDAEATMWAETLMTNLDGTEPFWRNAESVFAFLDTLGTALQVSILTKAPRIASRVFRAGRSSTVGDAARRTRAGVEAEWIQPGQEQRTRPREGGLRQEATDAEWRWVDDPAKAADDTFAPRSPDMDQVGRAATDPTPHVPADAVLETPKAIEPILPAKRPKDDVITTGVPDSPAEVTQRLGRQDGYPYQSEAEALAGARLAGLQEGSYSVIPVGVPPGRLGGDGGFLIELNPRKLSPDFKAGLVYFGRTQAYNSDLLIDRTWGFSQTAKENLVFNKLLKPVSKLPEESQRRVLDEIAVGDGRGFAEATDLKARGWNDDEVFAYNRLITASRRSYWINNTRAKEVLRSDGFTEAWTAPSGEVAAFVTKVGNTAPEGRVIDGSTGTARILQPGEAGTLYRSQAPVYDAAGRGYTRIWVPDNAANKGIGPLPRKVLTDRPGHVTRYNEHPYYITTKVGKWIDDRWVLSDVIHAGAKSPKRADEIVRALNSQLQPGQEPFSSRPANEYNFRGLTSGEDTSTVERGYAQRLLTTRRDEVIRDYDSQQPSLLDVGRSLERMTRSAALEAGVGRWAEEWMRKLQATYPQISWSLGSEPNYAAIPINADRTKARRLFEDIRRTVGLDPTTGWGWVNSIQQWLFDTALNRAGSLELARQLSGQNPAALRALKTATAIVKLVTNPHKQFILNLSMVPGYTQIDGGLDYIKTGRMFRETSVVLAHSLGEDAFKMAAKAADISLNHARKLVLELGQSGVTALAAEHTFVLHTMMSGSARVQTTGTWVKQLEAMMNLSAGIGVKAGARLDRTIGYLAARNRWKVHNPGKEPGLEDIKEIASFAENELAMGQSSADMLPGQRGIAGIVTQFMSHSIKFSARTFYQAMATIDPRKWKAGSTGIGQLSAAELRRQFLMNPVFWGGSAFGVYHLGEAINREFKQQYGTELPEPVVLLLNQGFNGALATYAARLLDHDKTDHASKLEWSATFAPGSFLVPQARDVASWFKSAIIGGEASYAHFPSFQLGADLLDIARTGWMLSTSSLSEPSEALEVVLDRAGRMFPAVNNIIRGYEALNSGFWPGSKGHPLVEVTPGEAVAGALFGVDSQNEKAYYELLEARYGKFVTDADDAESAEGLNEQADADWKVIEAILTNTDLDQRAERAGRLMDDLRVLRRKNLKQEYWRYLDYLNSRIEKFISTDPTRFDQLVDRMLDELRWRKPGAPLPSDDYLARIEAVADFPRKAELVDFLKRMRDDYDAFVEVSRGGQ